MKIRPRQETQLGYFGRDFAEISAIFSRDRGLGRTLFLEKKLAGKTDLASPEEDQQDSDYSDSVCVKELENTSLACGSNRDLVSSEIPTPSPAADPDLLNEKAILREFLDTIDKDKDKEVLFNVAYNVTDNISS